MLRAPAPAHVTGQKGKAEQQGQGCGVPRATAPRATVPAHHRTADAVHVCIQQRPRPGASVTQDPGVHPPHLPRRGTRQGLHSSSQLRACVLRVRGCEHAYVQPSPGRACVRGASRWSITSQCQQTESHGRRPAHSLHQPCGLGALDAGCKVPGPRRLRSRSASSRGPAEARSPVSAADPARARRRRGCHEKTVAKIINTLCLK